ncbi:MAG: hypothetical protein PHU42_00765 [Patescibacteria group bacterium]|nr:hypothetical protein [Patescibacteria group bacterium]
MKKSFPVFFAFLLVVVLSVSGCGGGGSSAGPAAQQIVPVDVHAAQMVDYLDPFGEGDIMQDTYQSYDYQIARSGERKNVGVYASGLCSGGMYGCGIPGVTVRFRLLDGDTVIGPIIHVVSSINGVATTSVDLSTISVTPDRSKILTVKAEVVGLPAGSAQIEKDMIIEVVPGDFVENYAAEVASSSLTIALTSGEDAIYPDNLYSIHVTNTGNTAWSNFDNRKNRIYMVLSDEAEIQSPFYDGSSWYDQRVVSDMTMWNQETILPGESGDLMFYLSGKNAAPGEYQECFKLQTKPDAIDSGYLGDWAGWYYNLINPTDIEGSEFCLAITVLPADSGRVAGRSLQSIPEDKLFGKMYWENKAKARNR